MTDDDFDIDAPEELEKSHAAKPSFREAWESNPILKVAAVVLAGAILIGTYMVFFSNSGELAKSIVNLSDSMVAKQVPGKDVLDPAYRKALEEANRKAAEVAEQSGGSALPTPIGTSKTGGLDMPPRPEKLKSDPLAEWRKLSETHQAPEAQQAACPPPSCFENLGKGGGNAAARTLYEEAKRRASKNGTTVEKELHAMETESLAAEMMLNETKRRAVANGTTVGQELAKIVTESLTANMMFEEAKRRAAANGTTIEKEMSNMVTESLAANTTLDEAKRLAAANGTTVEKELSKMTAEKVAEKPLFDEARRRSTKNSTTVEEELRKMAVKDSGAKTLYEEARRRTAANGLTIEQELAKMAAEKTVLEEAKRRAASNGTSVEEELAKTAAHMVSERTVLEEAKRRAAANGTPVEQELAKMTSEMAVLEEAKRKAAANGTTVERELAKTAADKDLFDEAFRLMAADMKEVVPMLKPVRPQQALRANPKAVQLLADQMRVIVAAQVPMPSRLAVLTKKDSLYTEEQARLKEIKDAAKNAPAAPPGTGEDKIKEQTIVPAGSVAYAQLLNELNSDVTGPVLAQILSGPFAGGRAIGKMSVKQGFSEYMVLTFTRVVKDSVSYAANGIALDENTTLAGQATDVDHHYVMRILLPAAGKFVQGYGSAMANTGGTTTQVVGAGATTSGPAPSPKQSIYKGVEEAGKSVADMLAKNADRPVTISVAKGTAMGILFIDPVTTKDAGK